jgi:hypothetical protein
MKTHKIIPLNEYWECINNGGRGLIGLYHNIDVSVEYLFPIIKAEELLGVYSAFFLSSWDTEIWRNRIEYLKGLEKKGFEIGLLYATISEYIIERFTKTQREIFQRGLNLLREHFSICGCSSHKDEIGDKFGYSNYCIFKEGADKWRRLNQIDNDVTAIDVFSVSPTIIPIGELSLKEFGLDYESCLLPGRYITIDELMLNNKNLKSIKNFDSEKNYLLAI